MSVTQAQFYGGAFALAVTTGQRITFGLARVWNLSASASGRSVKLDDARRVPLGWGQFTIHNSGSNAIDIKDNGGTTLFALGAGKVATLGLCRNATAAGKWVWSLGDVGASASTSRGTRPEVTNPPDPSIPEPDCASVSTPTGCSASFPCLSLSLEDFTTCIEAYPTAKQNVLIALRFGDAVTTSCEWIKAAFGIDICACAPGGTFTDGSGQSFSWSRTGYDCASCGDDRPDEDCCYEIGLVWINPPP